MKMCDNRNKFCYICGLFVDKKHRVKLEKNNALVEGYKIFFNSQYASSRWYEPEYACSECSSKLKLSKSKNYVKSRMLFSTPMIWHHQPYHKSDDCYFCQTNTKGHHFKTRKLIDYADVLTVTKPVAISDTVESKSFEESKNFDDYDQPEKFPSTGCNDAEFIPCKSQSMEKHLVSNADFNDLVRDLGLSIRQTEMLGSRLNQWNLVEDDFKITSVRNDDRLIFTEIFKADDDYKNLVYCSDVCQLFDVLDYEHVPDEWRLFIDGSCKSLKAVLLHNKNELPSVPLAYATDMKEAYDTLEKILRSINYATHKWKIVSDLKVLTILLGMQGGYTKYPCYLCEWDSRAPNKYERSEWPPRRSFRIGQKNVLNPPLVRPEEIILPPLHLKLGYAKQFVKALKVDSEAFTHLKTSFPYLSDAKIKGGIFVGPQIRKLVRDDEFALKLNAVERRAWNSFISLCHNFLGNKKSNDYVNVVQEFLDAYGKMGCNMSIKIHFLHSHLDFFPENLGQLSDEQGERFHQEILSIEKRFQGKSSIKMLSNYCWSLKRETEDNLYKRRRSIKHF